MHHRSTPRRRTAAMLLSLALLLTACGGSGAAGTSFDGIDLGTKPLVPASLDLHPFVNPTGEPATATLVSADAPFSVEAGTFPAAVASEAALDVPVVFTAPSSGVHVGSITVAFEGLSRTEQVTVTFRATAETVTWALAPASLDFGAQPSGVTVERTVVLSNQSAQSLVTLSGITLPSPHLSLVSDPFPIAVGAQGSLALTVRYTPPSAGSVGGTAVVGAGDLGGMIEVPVVGGSFGSGTEEITTYGSVPLDMAGFTDRLEVQVPADAISLTVEAVGPEGVELGLGELIGPGDRVYENTQLTGAYTWFPERTAFATGVPNTDKPEVQLVPGGGTYVFRIVMLSGDAATVEVRAVVERREAGFASYARLPLNVWLARGLPVSAAGAASDESLQSVLAKIDDVLAAEGIRLDEVDYYDLASSAFDHVNSQAEFAEMLRSTGAASEERLNLCFVLSALDGGIVGVAGTLGGPKRNGTSVSGVMVTYGTFTPNFVGRVAAHEIGHYCGLFHTVEREGQHDFIDDTVNCPPRGTSAECPVEGGGNLMHYIAIGGEDLTEGQLGVVRGHPHLLPGIPGAMSKPRFAKALMPWTDTDTFQLRSLGEAWCGTCKATTRSRAAAAGGGARVPR